MATRDTGERDEDVWRLSLEIPTEPQMIAQFARQIILMVDGSIGEARLNGIELLYAHPDRPLPPGLADEVRAHRHPNELVWQWSQDSESEAVTVTMIEELIVREHKDIVKKMEGRCAGGGRSLRFAKSAGGWQLTGESSWIS
jgi:hypothetical protein